MGAGQTIDQVKLYGGAAKWSSRSARRGTPARLRWLRPLACRAFWTALVGGPAPVHLNFPLREPLVLERALLADGAGLRRAVATAGARELVRHAPGPQATALWTAREARLAQLRPRAVVLGGRGEHGAAARSVRRPLRGLGWPMLADPLSGARARRGRGRPLRRAAARRGFAAGPRPSW